jgi:hypothetical protein
MSPSSAIARRYRLSGCRDTHIKHRMMRMIDDASAASRVVEHGVEAAAFPTAVPHSHGGIMSRGLEPELGAGIIA